MRIPESHAGEAAATEAQRAGSPPQTAAQAEAGRVSAANGDEIEWSGLSKTLRTAASADSASRAERLARIAADYAAGNYHVDARSLSRRIVEAALAGD